MRLKGVGRVLSDSWMSGGVKGEKVERTSRATPPPPLPLPFRLLEPIYVTSRAAPSLLRKSAPGRASLTSRARCHKCSRMCARVCAVCVCLYMCTCVNKNTLASPNSFRRPANVYICQTRHVERTRVTTAASFFSHRLSERDVSLAAKRLLAVFRTLISFPFLF